MNSIRGLVTGKDNTPLVHAMVFISSLKLQSVTDSTGTFSFDNLTAKTVNLKISCMGYETLVQRINLQEKKQVVIKLKESFVKLDGIVVEGNYIDEKKKKSPLNIEIVNDDYMKQNLGGSLMKSLERLPGVSTIDIGSSQSKPVIRGLSFNRVVVVENSIKHEAQQWGADHGLEIDQYAIDYAEIIKGPASLAYGSEAIGGIIDIRNKTIPAENTIGGSIDFSGKTNNDFAGTSVSLHARKKDFFLKVRATFLDYGDYKVPTDEVAIYSYTIPLHENQLRNTAGEERNIHTSFGVVLNQFRSIWYVSNVHSKYGFFANAHGFEPRNVNHTIHDASSRDIIYPFQEVNHFKIINRSTYHINKWKVESDFGYQRNYREEWSQYTQHGYMPAVFPGNVSFDPDLEREFQKDMYSANTSITYRKSEHTQFTLGVNGEYKENAIGGRGFIIPAFRQFNLGSFAIVKYDYSENSTVQAGVRYDQGSVSVSSHNDWFVSPIAENGVTTNQFLQRSSDLDKNFSNMTWSVGYNLNQEKWVYKLNIGKSFRMPIPKELATNGVNYHRFSFEVGNADLSPEVSHQIDAGVEFHSSRFAIGATPFVNYFSNYVYLNPTPTYNRLYGFGNQVFEYTQSEVLRYGGEIHVHYEILSNLRLGAMGEYVYAEQLSGAKKGYSLPFSPPATAIFNIKYQHNKMKSIENPYFSLDYKLASTQRNIVPPEVITPGYQVFNLRIGGDLIFQRQKISIALQVQNLLNSHYFNHTSYYRLINVPEPGRNFILNISIPFSGYLKRH